jgi:hypothetical protein
MRGRVCRLQLLLAICLRFRLLFLSHRTAHRATVEVFDPASTRDIHGKCLLLALFHGNCLLFARIHGIYLLIPLTWKARSAPNRSPRIRISLDNALASRCLAMDYSVSIRCRGDVCLTSRWITIDFRSGSTIPAFRLHVIMCFLRV